MEMSSMYRYIIFSQLLVYLVINYLATVSVAPTTIVEW